MGGLHDAIAAEKIDNYPDYCLKDHLKLSRDCEGYLDYTENCIEQREKVSETPAGYQTSLFDVTGKKIGKVEFETDIPEGEAKKHVNKLNAMPSLLHACWRIMHATAVEDDDYIAETIACLERALCQAYGIEPTEYPPRVQTAIEGM
jgi:hypothetical protein